jgi:DNA repair protein RecN (Recombination protein N)
MVMKDTLKLENLTLKNFATFTDQTINFENGFNAIIGETGSGKSLILDALQLILGQRADKKLVRKGAEYTSIEAVFRTNDEEIRNFFDNNGYPFDENEIVIKRIIYSNGKNKSFINFQACNLTILNSFAKRFIDLVGQFENQKLLSENYQLVLLDSYAKNNDLNNKFSNTYNQLIELKQKVKELEQSNMEVEQRLDYVKFQLTELKELNPNTNDEADLLRKRNLISNFEKLSHTALEAQSLIHGDDNNDGILNLLRHLNKVLTKNGEILELGNMDKLDDFTNILEDISYQLDSKANEEFDEEEIQLVIDRLDLYQRLKRKFNTDTNGLILALSKLEEEKSNLENIGKNLDSIHKEISSTKAMAMNYAHDLHDKRKIAAKSLSKSLTKEVDSLRMKGATVKITLNENELGPNGISKIIFEAETNPGEGFHKVKEVASGGELSRILLALRQVISSKDSISIFLFDEIDTGIGGETALCIGKALSKVSTNSQVIAITHLPQIASFATKLVIVDKEFDKKSERTYSTVKELVGNQMKEEIKKMSPVALD